MAEAEDVIADVARHATVFAQQLWHRHRGGAQEHALLHLADVAQRLDLLIAAVFGRSFPLRPAQAQAPPTWLSGVFGRRQTPPPGAPSPATDDQSIWLPATEGPPGATATAMDRFRTMALQQAMRASRGSAAGLPQQAPLLQRELYLLLEARAADDALLRLLPGMAAPLARQRHHVLLHRPRLERFPQATRLIESLARAVLAAPVHGPLAPDVPDVLAGLDPQRFELPASPADVVLQAQAFAESMTPLPPSSSGPLLWRDAWTGDLRPPPVAARMASEQDADEQAGDNRPAKTARLVRRPEVRDEIEDEDDRQPGAWMVQPSPPHEQAEDPMGMQRPTDRDTTVAAEEFADALSELPQARLVSAPGKPREILLSDDPPKVRARRAPVDAANAAPVRLQYPEWDWRAGTYRMPGATVLPSPAPAGPQQWIDDTLAQRAGMLHEIRRRFEMLRAQPVRMRRQLDGDNVDLDAWIEARADFRSGLPMSQRLYQAHRRSRRDMAIMLLIDVSGSTDGWIAPQRRVIDVEREALLMVCIALEGLAEPYSVLAFSGEGPQAVVVRSVKRFDEPYGSPVAQRIAGLEPEHYTRAGAAIRHAATLLMHQSAQHRLLLLLSDGKPNDVDDYEGRYGVEDMRQAVTEATLQGISPFCLTIDRQAAGYLPAVFGPRHYALLPRPELLPTVLLEWLRRLMSR